jgi:hypothetical protein
LTVIGSIFLNWRNSGMLPGGSLYDMPADEVHMLLAIGRVVDAFLPQHDATKAKNAAYQESMLEAGGQGSTQGADRNRPVGNAGAGAPLPPTGNTPNAWARG